MTEQTSISRQFECMSPILRVENLGRSTEYYCNILGFKIDWLEPKVMAGISRDRLGLMLCQQGQGHPGTWVWIGVEDAEQLHREYKSKGAIIRLPPTNYPWAYEFHVQDPDGHVLRFGSEQKRGEPFSDWVAWYESENA